MRRGQRAEGSDQGYASLAIPVEEQRREVVDDRHSHFACR